MSSATEDEQRYTARDVELWQCTKCGQRERFPRYNDPIKLLSTRRGRCGEFANVLPRTTMLMIVFCNASSQRWRSNKMGMEF
jgi:heterodisulfide reductase subunit C